MEPAPPVALTIAGSDCSAGAGIQADLKTFQHFQVHGLTAITCVVSETANVVRAVHAVPVEILADQVALLLDSFPVLSVKTGMLFSAEHVRCIAGLLKKHPALHLVVDPVMIASTGASLLEPDAIAAYCEELLPLASVITPNLPEAESLLGKSITDEESLHYAALELSEKFNTAVLLKGGHLAGPDCIDLLAEDGKIIKFSAPRIPLPGSHGTGCTLSAGIAAGLAKGATLAKAIEEAKQYLVKTLHASYSYQVPGRPLLHALNQGTTFAKNEA